MRQNAKHDVVIIGGGHTTVSGREHHSSANYSEVLRSACTSELCSEHRLRRQSRDGWVYRPRIARAGTP